MRVTQKGQVTIPKHIRDSLGIKPGSEVEFVAEKDHARLVRTVQRPATADMRREFAERLQRAQRHFNQEEFRGMGGKEYVDWLRGPPADVDPD